MTYRHTTPFLAELIAAAARRSEVLFAEGLTNEQLVYQLNGRGSHILWMVGHLAIVADLLIGYNLTGEKHLPESYAKLFGVGTTPSPKASDYPPFEEILAAYRSSHARVIEILGGMEDSALAEPTPARASDRAKAMFPTVGAMFQMFPFHLSYHAGQISMLRMAQGLSGISVPAPPAKTS